VKYIVKQFEVDAVQLKGACTIPNTANPDQPIEGQAGDWLIIMPNGHQAILSDEKFHEAYELPAAPKRRSSPTPADGDNTNPTPPAAPKRGNGKRTAAPAEAE
jgi:hypothetical protein